MSNPWTQTLRLYCVPVYVFEGGRNVLVYSCKGLCLKISTFDAKTSMCSDSERSCSKANFLIYEFFEANWRA